MTVLYRLLIIILIANCTSAAAQRRRPKPKVQEPTAEELRMQQLVSTTQRIMFIDSLVTSPSQLLPSLLIHREAGLIQDYNTFFSVNNQPGAYVHCNELGTMCVYSMSDSLHCNQLYMRRMEAGQWAEPVVIRGINDDGRFERINFPFMMPDGRTLYFAAIGAEGLGGYDIYATRYDFEEQCCLKPENIGMPFNSTANDLFYFVDEYLQIGWFATDRRQEDGQVCLYTFLPTESRQIYGEDVSMEERMQLANISHIADTWHTPQQRQEAMNRLAQHKASLGTEMSKPALQFIVNDDVVYTRLSDFSFQNAEKFQLLTQQKELLKKKMQALNKSRSYYVTASQQERLLLKQEILQDEQQVEALENSIAKMEKEIRNTENNK